MMIWNNFQERFNFKIESESVNDHGLISYKFFKLLMASYWSFGIIMKFMLVNFKSIGNNLINIQFLLTLV